MGRAGDAAPSPQERLAAVSGLGRCPGGYRCHWEGAGRSHSFSFHGTNAFCSRVRAGPALERGLRPLSAPGPFAFLGWLPNEKHSENAARTNPGLVGAGSDFTGARGVGSSQRGALLETPPAGLPLNLSCNPKL